MSDLTPAVGEEVEDKKNRPVAGFFIGAGDDQSSPPTMPSRRRRLEKMLKTFR